MNDIQKQQIIDQATDSILATERDIAALVGLVNALRAYRVALQSGSKRALAVLEQALGFESLDNLFYEFHLISEDAMGQIVMDTEEFMKRHFNCDIREIKLESARANSALNATRTLINHAAGGKG